MKIIAQVTLTIVDSKDVVSLVTMTEETHVGDNPRWVRSEFQKTRVIEKASSRALDAIAASTGMDQIG